MKISDLLGEGWESEERSDTGPEPHPTGPAPAAPVAPVANPGRAESVASRSPDVIASLASWSPAPESLDPDAPAPPVSARAQLADLAAGLAAPAAPPLPPVEPELVEEPDEIAGLALVVDDLLPDATKRSRASSRGSSRSGSRRRGR